MFNERVFEEKSCIRVQAYVHESNPPPPGVKPIELWHGISNIVVCVTRKASDQPAHRHSPIRAFASRLSSL